MSEFKVGDQVSWIRARQWKLKDSTGTILRVLKEAWDLTARYEVQFPFGTVHLCAKQVELVNKASNRHSCAVQPKKTVKAPSRKRTVRLPGRKGLVMFIGVMSIPDPTLLTSFL